MISNVIQIDDLVLYFTCMCAEMIICELPFKILTRPLNSVCYILDGYVNSYLLYTVLCFDLLVLCVRINGNSVIFNPNCNSAFLPMASI